MISINLSAVGLKSVISSMLKMGFIKSAEHRPNDPPAQ